MAVPVTFNPGNPPTANPDRARVPRGDTVRFNNGVGAGVIVFFGDDVLDLDAYPKIGGFWIIPISMGSLELATRATAVPGQYIHYRVIFRDGIIPSLGGHPGRESDAPAHIRLGDDPQIVIT